MAASRVQQAAIDNPFLIANTEAYQRWRDVNLSDSRPDLCDLVVEIKDPLALQASERQAILDRCRKTNIALYVAPAPGNREVPLAIGRQLGLHGLDRNWLGDASQRRLLYRARYYDRIRGTDWD